MASGKISFPSTRWLARKPTCPVVAKSSFKRLKERPCLSAIRKLKDGQGQYLWQPSLTAGTPDTLLNRPVYTSAYAPIIEAGAKTIAFGDFGYYWIADRQGRSFKRLNELFATTGQVGFLASQRVDGKLILQVYCLEMC